MGFLFGERKLDREEFSQCLSYLEEHYRLTTFQTKEADIYNEALTRYGSSLANDSNSAEEMLEVAARFKKAAHVLLARSKQLVPVPESAGALHFAWETVFSDYTAWVDAQYAVYAAIAEGNPPFVERVQTLFRQHEQSHRKALREEKKLGKLLRANGLTPSDIQRRCDKAFAAIEAEDWRPEDVLGEQIEAPPEKEEPTDKTEGIRKLDITIGTWALLSTKPINDAWTSLTGEKPMSMQSNFVVRSEMLWFFLHMMDRYAFAIGGPEARATLQDAIVESAIRRLVATSFDSSHVKKGFDVEGWQARMVSDALEDFNDAGLNYSSCTVLVTENKADFSREESILGKLGARICSFTDQNPSNVNLRLLIWATAAEFLTKSGLKQQVEELVAGC